MFYSQCILSRKGPLKPIWVAAYCHNKLNKEQVSNTNISSSVDEIILNEVTVAYRVLAYLLLGVVRIYSKKVEYLYHDCNEVLSKINSFVPLKKLKEGMCAPYSSITLPERFELDGFDLELPEDMNSGNVATHQQITLEERPENAGKNHYSSIKYYHELDLAHFEINDAVYTPVREALSPHWLENYVVVYPTDYETFLEPGTEKFQGNQFVREEFPNIGINFESSEPVELGTQCNEVESRTELERILEVIPPSPGKSGVHSDGDLLAATTDETPQRSSPPNNTDFGTNCGDEEPMELRTPPIDVGNRAKRIRFLDITPPNPGKSGVVNEGDPLAGTKDGTSHESSFTSDTGASTPELMGVSTPAKKEPPRFTRKRKHLFDHIVVLSNEIMKQSLNDSSSLVAKRRKGPLNALNFWRTYKFPNFYQDFTEPLIPCTAQLSTLFPKRSVGTPQLVEFSDGPTEAGEDRYDISREPSEDRAHYERNTVDDSTWNSVGSPTTRDGNTTCEPEMEIPVNSVFRGENDVPETVAIGLNLIDEDSGPCQEDNNQNQNGWSTRTSKVAIFLCKSFLDQKEQESDVLNLKPVLEARTRKENARLFYEILVLKSQGFVEVKQEAPYGDICLLSTSQLMATA